MMLNTSIDLPEEMVAELDDIAHERSEPGSRVSRGQVIREALDDYIRERECDRSPPDTAQAHN